MHDYETFTVDTDNFPLDRMKNITDKYKYVPIVEPSIRSRQGYAYEEGKKINWKDGFRALWCILKYNTFAR